MLVQQWEILLKGLLWARLCTAFLFNRSFMSTHPHLCRQGEPGHMPETHCLYSWGKPSQSFGLGLLYGKNEVDNICLTGEL